MVEVPTGYESGPDATIRAGAAAWQRADAARAVVVVEGISDKVAVETAAMVRNHDLDRAGVVVVPIGGAHAIGRALERLARRVDHPVIGGLCDVAESGEFRAAFAMAGLGEAGDRTDLERHRVFVCVDDLEDELLRAAGPEMFDRVVGEQGDANSFRTMRNQAAWREQPFSAQARRFLGAGARRKSRYADALIRALGPGLVPSPITGVLDHALHR